MNTASQQMMAEFGPETRFEFRPVSTQPFRVEHENQFEALKRRLLSARLEEIWEPELSSVVRRAANEAEALAWVTPYPLLFFPALFEEKALEALHVADRQAEVRLRTRELLAV